MQFILMKNLLFFFEIPQGIVIKKLEHIRTTLDVLHPLFFDSRKYHTSISWMRYWEIKYRTKDYVRFYWFFRRIIWFFGWLTILWWAITMPLMIRKLRLWGSRLLFWKKNTIIWRKLGRIKCNWKIDLFRICTCFEKKKRKTFFWN